MRVRGLSGSHAPETALSDQGCHLTLFLIGNESGNVMSEYNIISQSLWHSEKFKSLSKDQFSKLLYIYFLNSPHSNSCGCYPIHIGYIMADLNCNEEDARKGIESLSKAYLIDYDFDENTVFIPFFLSHNQPRNPKHAIKVFNDTLSIPSKKMRAVCTLELMRVLEGKGWKLPKEKQQILESISKGYPELETPRPRLNPDSTHKKINIKKNNPIENDTREIFSLAEIEKPKIDFNEIFEQWWKVYPDFGKDGDRGAAFKGSKQTAKKIFLKLAKKEKNHGEFISNFTVGLARYRDFLEQIGTQQAKHATTWLNQRGWEDDYTLSKTAKSSGGGHSPNNIGEAINLVLENHQRRREEAPQRRKALGLDDDTGNL